MIRALVDTARDNKVIATIKDEKTLIVPQGTLLAASLEKGIPIPPKFTSEYQNNDVVWGTPTLKDKNVVYLDDALFAKAFENIYCTFELKHPSRYIWKEIPNG